MSLLSSTCSNTWAILACDWKRRCWEAKAQKFEGVAQAGSGVGVGRLESGGKLGQWTLPLALCCPRDWVGLCPPVVTVTVRVL